MLRKLTVVALLVILSIACSESIQLTATPIPPLQTTQIIEPSASPLPILEPSATPQPTSEPTATPLPEILRLTILYTDDEHGWMIGEEEGQGVAEIYALFQEQYAYGQDDAVILLSGGDNWIGPAISTWFQGRGMVEAMNTMGYSASAIGNHEFDFGVPVMLERMAEANFPYLAANLRYANDGSIPVDLGIQPYVILDIQGIQVGIVALSSIMTPVVSNPAYMKDFIFTDYTDALREFVPQMREAGAQIILLISHLCPDELQSLAQEVADLNIPFMGGGHCHWTYSGQVGESILVLGGPNLGSYAYAYLDYNRTSGTVSLGEYGVLSYHSTTVDSTVAEIVAYWQEQTDAELNEVIGYLGAGISKDSLEIQTLITEAWLWSYPNAQVALTNLGGIRDNLPAGELTLAELVSVMPFDNTLVEVHLTGKQLREVLDFGSGKLAVGGLHIEEGVWVVNRNDKPLRNDRTYTILVNSFMYSGGDGYTMLALGDPPAYETGIDWRQPVIDWIVFQQSNPDHPLDEAIAALGQ